MLTKEQIFQGFSNLNVLVIGDLMIDAYTWGKVTRISPEAPVPVVNATKKEIRLGGAGNVVRNLVSLGAKPYVVSVVGADEMGKSLKDLLQNEGVEVRGIVTDATRPTTVKERIIAGSQQLLRIDSEVDSLVSEEIEKK